MNFRKELRGLTLKERDALTVEFTREKCLIYAQKLHTKIAEPKADLLIKQARNMTTKEVPWSVFGHQAHQDLAYHQLKGQDEMFLEMAIEYEDYLKRLTELDLEESEDYKTIVEAFKDRIRELIG